MLWLRALAFEREGSIPVSIIKIAERLESREETGPTASLKFGVSCQKVDTEPSAYKFGVGCQKRSEEAGAPKHDRTDAYSRLRGLHS